MTSATETINRLHAALNAHDIEAFVACFAEDYRSEQPVHPDRTFLGRDQVRKNWSAIFDSMPGLQAEQLRICADGATAWIEWHWTALLENQPPFDWRGTCLFGVEESRITWARLYMEPVDQSGRGIDATVEEMVGAEDRRA